MTTVTSFAHRSPHLLSLALAVLAVLSPCRDRCAPADPTTGHVEIRQGKLRVVVADNRAYGKSHRAGYSGVAELYHGDSRRSLFVPLYAGLNFEHIFSGDRSSYDWNIFEPRRAPMNLRRLDQRRVELRQARTENWPLASTLTYSLSGDGAIDLTLSCVPLEDVWKKHGYIGLFFASYIEAPEDMAIHFIGRSRPGKGDPRRRWIRHLPPRHGTAASHRPAGSTWDPSFDPGFDISLASGFSDHEYLEPFYYGVSHGKVFIMMFERFERPRSGAEIRFAQSPSGGGVNNPAWDFIFFQRRYAIGEAFAFRARAVYRDFNGREDVVRAYEEWSGAEVMRPAAAAAD